MSDNTDSSPEERPSGNGESLFTELNRMREALNEKEKEVNRLQREVHKLKVCYPYHAINFGIQNVDS